jgi:hypothetical protein
MWYHAASNTHVGRGQAFTLDDINYPANWLELASADEIAALGFVEVAVVGARGDDRYVDNAETLVGDTLTITAAPKSLAAIQALKWGDIKARRDALMASGFQVGEHWFHSDASSRIQHLGLKDKARDALAAGGTMTDAIVILGQPVQWKTLGGAFATVTVQLAHDIVTAAGNLDAQAFAAGETHRLAMEADADPATYDLSAGWPAVFGDPA